MVHHFERDDTEGDDYVGVEEWSFYLCPTCKAPTLLCWYWQQKNGEITSKIGRSIVYPSNLFETKSVPENIRKAFMAAAATKSIDTLVSPIAWWRVLELTCKDLGAQGRNLYEKISYLSSKSILPHLLTDASNLIRLLGNEGAHSIESEVSRVNLSNVEDLVRHIIEYVYILSEKISDISNSYKEVNP